VKYPIQVYEAVGRTVAELRNSGKFPDADKAARAFRLLREGEGEIGSAERRKATAAFNTAYDTARSKS
jgi:hypothetical protein